MCREEMDRNAPLGEGLAFLRLMPVRSTSPVPVQDRRTVTRGTAKGLLANAAPLCWGRDNIIRLQGWAAGMFPFTLGDNTHAPFRERHALFPGGT